MTTEDRAGTYTTGIRWAALSLMCAAVSACGTTHTAENRTRGKEYFSEKEYGVKASPRVAWGNNIPKGGGRYMVGDPYVVKGKWYYPKEDYAYNKVGIASWYGSAFHGRVTANGEVYDQQGLTAAHPTFPLPSYARVTNVENGSSVIVRVNDRGPYHSDRLIDLSNKTADMLDLRDSGTGKVRVKYVGRAPLDGHDMPYLMASYIPKGSRIPSVNPGGQIATGVMVASNRMSGDMLPAYGGASDRAPKRATAVAVPVPTAIPAVAVMPAQAPIPVSYSTTAYSGSTPTAPGAKQPAAFNQQPGTVWSRSAPAAETGAGAVVLPVIGPIPRDRPSIGRVASGGTGTLVAGYSEEPVKTVYVELAFDAVMVRNDGLTQESILASYKRQHQAASLTN
jgi:rare lipoprotein A